MNLSKQTQRRIGDKAETMKRIKVSAAAIAVALMATATSYGPDAWSPQVRDVAVQQSSDATPQVSAKAQREKTLLADWVSPAQVSDVDSTPQVDVSLAHVDSTLPAPAPFVGPSQHADEAVSDDSPTAPRSPRSKMSGPVAALAAAGGPGMVEIVARYGDRPELFDDEYVASLGGKVTRAYATLDMRAISIPASSLEALAVDDNVDWLSLDDEMSVTSTAHQAMNVPTSASPNAGYTGSNVGIAVLDTGVASHGDLGNNIIQYSFLNGAYPVPEIVNGEVVTQNNSAREDLFGHGTHVAGILTGSGASSNGSHDGIAKQAPLLSLQVLNGAGSGSMSDVMAALDWLLVYGSYFDIKVVNLSLGKGISESNTTDPLVIAVENLWDAGIVVVVAAGNDGFSGSMTINSPANSRKVITVGSLTDSGTGTDYSDDFVSSFSSTGPTVGDLVMKPDLVAPGNRIVAAIPDESLLGTYLPTRLIGCIKILGISTCEDAYLEMSGTSMATPRVAAAVALMLEKDPTLTPATVKARLMRSARKLDAPPTAIGAGLLDVDAALNDTGVVTGEALSPLVAYDATLDATLLEETGALWGAEIWSASYLYHGGVTWVTGDSTADGGLTATGYGWTNSGVEANGYGWTDGGVHANGYGWTNGGVHAKGYGWTSSGVEAKSLLGIDGSGFTLNDDPILNPNP